MNDIEILSVIVNKMPENCSECPLLTFSEDDDCTICSALPPDHQKFIKDHPLVHGYRKPECRLRVESEN